MNIKRKIIHLTIIFLISVIIRLFFSFPPSLHTTGDGAEYLNLATHLYENNIFSYDGQKETLFRPPLYPFILSVSFHLFGRGEKTIFYTNILLSSITPVIFMILLLELKFQYRISILLSILLSMFNIFTSSGILTENLYSPLLLLSIYLIIKSNQNENIEFSMFTGFIIALTALTRPIAFTLFLPILTIYKKPKKVIPIIFGAILTISPWLIRNYMISNKPCGIDDNLGYNLFIGNNPYKNIPPSFDVELFQIVNYISNGKRIDNKRLKNFAINYIKKYPIIFILKFPYKISRLLGSGITEIADYWKKRRFLNNSTIILFIINCGIPALLSLIFLFFLPYCFSCNKNFRFILYTLISFALVHGIFFGMPRYREPLIPLMLIVTIAGGVRFGKIGKFTPISLLLSTSLIYYYILELYSFTR